MQCELRVLDQSPSQTYACSILHDSSRQQNSDDVARFYNRMLVLDATAQA